jgi:hypothetical protein
MQKALGLFISRGGLRKASFVQAQTDFVNHRNGKASLLASMDFLLSPWSGEALSISRR